MLHEHVCVVALQKLPPRRCALIWTKNPLGVSRRVLDCALLDFVRTELETRTNFCELHILVGCFDVDMVSEGDEISVVVEGHDTLSVWFWRREEIFECVHHSITQCRAEILENEMWVLFGDSAV